MLDSKLSSYHHMIDHLPLLVEPAPRCLCPSLQHDIVHLESAVQSMPRSSHQVVLSLQVKDLLL